MNKVQIYSPKEIKPCKCDVEEQEITIVKSRKDERFSIFVSDNIYITKLKRTWENGAIDWNVFQIKDSSNTILGYIFDVPTKSISFRAGKPKNKSNIDYNILLKSLEKARKAKSSGGD